MFIQHQPLVPFDHSPQVPQWVKRKDFKLPNNLVQLDMDDTQNRITIALNQRRSTWRRRRWWMRLWLQRRQQYMQYERLMSELEVEDTPAFKNGVRVKPAMFRQLLNIREPATSKKDTF